MLVPSLQEGLWGLSGAPVVAPGTCGVPHWGLRPRVGVSTHTGAESLMPCFIFQHFSAPIRLFPLWFERSATGRASRFRDDRQSSDNGGARAHFLPDFSAVDADK